MTEKNLPVETKKEGAPSEEKKYSPTSQQKIMKEFGSIIEYFCDTRSGEDFGKKDGTPGWLVGIYKQYAKEGSERIYCGMPGEVYKELCRVYPEYRTPDGWWVKKTIGDPDVVEFICEMELDVGKKIESEEEVVEV